MGLFVLILILILTLIVAIAILIHIRARGPKENGFDVDDQGRTDAVIVSAPKDTEKNEVATSSLEEATNTKMDTDDVLEAPAGDAKMAAEPDEDFLEG